MTKRINKVSFFYFLTIIGLFLYSFTQVDLGLTLSRNLFLNNIVDSFQYIGFFNRTLSSYFFVSIILLLFGFYIYFLRLALNKKINKKNVWRLIFMTTGILVFSYNAFSYDIFNYIFDAKIYTHYQLNPYMYKALDFVGDPMLNFMRWTHRVYPYGPVWLVLTIPISYIGLNYFLLTFFLFKLLVAFSFLGSIYFIGKVFQKISPEKEVFGLVVFGMSPLVVIESLVSAHMDIVMMFFALFAIHQLINKNYFFSFLLLFISIGIKFATVFLLPVFVVVSFLQIKKVKLDFDIVFVYSIILMSLAVIVSAIFSGNFQPWYLILVLSFAVFISNKYYVFVPVIFISFFALLNYLPYIYLGNWDPPVPQILLWLQMASILISGLVILFFATYKKLNIKNKR